MIGALILALVLVGGIGVWLVTKSERDTIRSRFVGRRTIALDEFINMLNLPDVDRDCVADELNKLSVIFSIERELIRPTDSFDVEFEPVKGSEIDSPLGTLQFEIANEAKSRGIAMDNLNIKTVHDYIAFKCGSFMKS